MKTEDDKGNERPRRARRNAGLDPDTGADPKLAIPKLEDTLGDVIARGAAYAVPPDKYAAKGAKPRPIVPEKFRGITWANLATLQNPATGAPALGGVLAAGGNVLHGIAAVAEIRRRAEASDRVVLLGETHAGKTVTASAILHAAAELGAQHEALREKHPERARSRLPEERSRFVRETDLRDPEVLSWAKAAGFLVLDNLGWALNGANGESPLAAQLRAPACDLLDVLANRRIGSVRLVVTTWLEEADMARAYSGGVVARVYEGAEVIRIVRPEVDR